MRIVICLCMVVMLGLMTASVNAYQTATSFQFPLPNWNVNGNGFWSCQVNCYHLGEDVGASAGTPVYAIANGLVKEAQSHSGYGGTVIIEHYTGSEHIVSVVGHMKSSTLAVSAGQEVSKGQLIGYVGTSAENGGWSEHCHLGIHKGQYQSVTTCDNHWIYAGYDYSGCTQNDWYTPTDFVNTHQATFACTYAGQTSKDASGYYNLHPGDVATFWVDFTNTSSQGSPAWSNTNGNGNYVELKSCYQDGSTPHTGWLYNPNDWINSSRVTTMNQSSVARNGVARFEFIVKVPDNATVGVHDDNYFRIIHATGGAISDWGGLNFPVNVIPHAQSDFDGNGKSDVGAYLPFEGDWWVALSVGSAFVSSGQWLDFWAQENTSTPHWKRISGDFTGDGKTDVGAYLDSLGQWWVATSTGSGFSGGGMWLDNWAVKNSSTPEWVPLTGDFNGDGKTDICAYLPSQGQWYVAASLGSSFTSNGLWLDAFAIENTSTPEWRPFVGDFDGNGKSDICAYSPSQGQWWVALSTGSAFVSSGLWLDAFAIENSSTPQWRPVIGYFNNDGKSDICAYLPSSGEWWVATSSGSAFVNGSRWLNNWAVENFSTPEWRPLAGDYNGDGLTDICAYLPSAGQWYVAASLGSSFTSNGLWLDAWAIENSSTPEWRIFKSTDTKTIPLVFSLSQNYPNPFNPTTTINYSLPKVSYVTLSVYNILGQKVTTLVDGEQAAGEHTAIWDADRFSSGIYFYRIDTDGITSTKKMLLLK